jgi:hypothetical protein
VLKTAAPPHSRATVPYRASELWWVMQHSDDPKKQALAVTCYCDDGGSEEHAIALIGGLVMNKTQFLRFARAWQKMLYDYRIDFVHMTDFVRANNGRYVGMHYEMKLALFSSVARLIRNNRIYSIVMGVPLKDFRDLVPEEVSKGLMRPHPMAYFMVVMQNSAIAEFEPYKDRLAYLLAHGSFENQLLDAHHWLAEWEVRSKISEHPHVGSATFALAQQASALQAADVIVWSSHRRLSDGLTDEFIPLNGIFAPHIDVHNKSMDRHIERIIPREGILTFANQMNKFINQNGRRPSALSETLGMNMKAKLLKRGKRKK